jgi:chromosome partitioning protein
MPNIVSIIIPKGGCGKTTTSANLVAYLAMQGYTTLAVDMDPQGNLTQHFGYDTDRFETTIYDLFLNTAQFSDVVLQKNANLHILPNNFRSIRNITRLQETHTPEFLLRDTLYPIQNNYDFIIVDCPPSLGLFTVNALSTSTDIILVVAPEFFPMKSIKPLYDEYLDIREKFNLSLNLKGVLLTMADFRLKHSREVADIIAGNFRDRLYKTYIRNNVALKEAGSYGQSIFEYDANSIGAMDYAMFAEEFLRDFAPAREKKAYYDDVFNALSKKEKDIIWEDAKRRIQLLQKQNTGEMPDKEYIRQAIIIERNRIIESTKPYRLAGNNYE